MITLFRFLFGYLNVRFQGDFCEKILNIAAKNRIHLFNCKFTKQGIEACISVADFRALRYAMRSSKTRVHILKKHGLPFILAKYNKRFGMAAGVALFLAVLYFLSSFIWIVEIEGNHKTKSEDIILACRKIGIKEGVLAKSITPKTAREKLLLELDTLAWASINIEGCRVTVNVSETKKGSPKSDKPCNLLASEDGVIKKLDINAGNCVVRVGDTVKKGQVLVSGIIESASGTHFVHSIGSVTAQIEKTVTLKENFLQTDRFETGNKKSKFVLEFFSLKIPLYLGSQKGDYNSKSKTHTASLFSKSLPIKLYEKQFFEVAEQNRTLSSNQLCDLLSQKLENQLKREFKAGYTVKSSEFVEESDGIILKAVVTAEKDIVLEENLLINAGNQENDMVN